MNIEKTIESVRDILEEISIDNIFRELNADKKLKDGEKYWFGVCGTW